VLYKVFRQKGNQHTVKLVATSQSRTASTAEDALAIAQSANVSTGRLTQAVLFGEKHDPAAIAGPDARDSNGDEALEAVRASGTSAIEGQCD